MWCLAARGLAKDRAHPGPPTPCRVASECMDTPEVNKKGPDPCGIRASAKRAGRSAELLEFSPVLSRLHLMFSPIRPAMAGRIVRMPTADVRAMCLRGRPPSGMHERSQTLMGSVCSDELAWSQSGCLDRKVFAPKGRVFQRGADCKESLRRRQAPGASFCGHAADLTQPVERDQVIPSHRRQAGAADRSHGRQTLLGAPSQWGHSASDSSAAIAAPTARSSAAPKLCWRRWPCRSINTRLGVPCMP